MVRSPFSASKEVKGSVVESCEFHIFVSMSLMKYECVRGHLSEFFVVVIRDFGETVSASFPRKYVCATRLLPIAVI